MTAFQPHPAPAPLPCDPQPDLPAQHPLQPLSGRIGICGHCLRPVGWGDAVARDAMKTERCHDR